MAVQPPSSAATAATNGGRPAQAGSSNKKKQQNKKAAGTNGQHVSAAAQAAALTEKAPSLDKLDESVKVQAADVAEQAEQQAAITAVDLVKAQESDGKSHADGEQAASTPLQATIGKRLKVLSKKLQRATTYADLPEEKLNADMKRIIASKGNLEGAVSELSETLKAIELAEKGAKDHETALRNEAITAAKRQFDEQHAKAFNMLFQLLHLHSLINASMQPSFAPIPMPTALQQATSQQVAAIGKLVADLSASSEVNSIDEKSNLMTKLVSGSSDSILEGVTFDDIRKIVEGLSTPAMQQPVSAEVEGATEEEALPVPSEQHAQSPILFMQASEIENGNGSATSGLPARDASEHASQSEGAAGLSIDAKSSLAVPNGNSTASSSQGEKANTASTAQVSAPPSALATPKVIDWSANDDDFGDLDIQPDIVEPTTAAAEVHVPGENGLAQSNGPVQARKSSEAQQETGKTNHRSANKQQKSKPQGSSNPSSAPVQKLAPQVDEDGFTVASSKRTKHILQQQQQKQQSGGSRGGRGGSRGGRSAGGAHASNGHSRGGSSAGRIGGRDRKNADGATAAAPES